MRTTITLDEGLLEAAKRRAARLDQTLDWVIADALRRELHEGDPADAAVALPDFAYEGGLLPGVDLDDKTAIETLLGDGRR